jgi:hypothetical protein
MKKVLFLDVDGVLNHYDSPGWRIPDHSIWVLDDDCVAQLKRILEATGAEIVLSSTWRLSEAGIEAVRAAIAPFELNDATAITWSAPRCTEIRRWLEDETDVKWAVLDDDLDADLEDGSFFQTDFEGGGLTTEIADAVIEFLNTERLESQSRRKAEELQDSTEQPREKTTPTVT